MFSLEQALASATRILAERQKNKTISYVLYYSNNPKTYEGKMSGFTIKELINKFRGLGKTYQLAFITKVNDDKILRYHNASVSKKFFALSRKGGKREKKTV